MSSKEIFETIDLPGYPGESVVLAGEPERVRDALGRGQAAVMVLNEETPSLDMEGIPYVVYANDLPDIRYFQRTEAGIACPCGRCGGFPAEPAERLMRLADKVREAAGAPMCPSSTVRCQAHNDELRGSVKNSRHISGRAMDFRIRGWGSERTLALVRKQPEVRYAYAIDESYVHMDVE